MVILRQSGWNVRPATAATEAQVATGDREHRRGREADAEDGSSVRRGGLPLIGFALFLELAEFHPALESFFRTYTGHSLAGGGPERTASGLNTALAEIHTYPSTLLWLKLGGVGHILVGIFVALAAIVRVLSLMPHRLSYEMERAQE